jgi:hypothetical protein
MEISDLPPSAALTVHKQRDAMLSYGAAFSSLAARC